MAESKTGRTGATGVPSGPQDRGTAPSALPRFWGLVLSVVVLGCTVGASSGLLARFFDWTQWVMLGFKEELGASGAYTVAPIRRFLSVVFGALAASLIWWFLRNHCRRVPSVSQAVKGQGMPVGPTLVHVLTQIFLVACGGSIGREVAPREAGAMLGGLWGRLRGRLGLEEGDRALLVAASAGAGFAGIYVAPLTGTFFGIEVLLGRVDGTVVAVNLAMSSLATLVGGSIKGFDAYYSVGGESFSPWFTLAALLLGLVMGVAGAGFRRATSWAQDHRTTDANIIWQLTGTGLLTGLVAMWTPQVMGNGRVLAQTGINQVPAASLRAALAPIGLLLVFAMIKVVFTVLTIRTGASGGTLTPSIALGSALGAAIGLVAHLLVPDLPVWQCAVVGAAALLAASQQAPLMALFMLMEVCRLPVAAALPMTMAVAAATVAAGLVCGHGREPSPDRPER
ncbi:chloride channel protein [Bifidobacterium favimelis]